jgi:hypothetical protein
MLTHRSMRTIAICALMFSLSFLLAEGKGGDGRSPAPKRGAKSAETELQEVADQHLAETLQDEENKKKESENNTGGGLSGEALARFLQNEEKTKSLVKSEAKSEQSPVKCEAKPDKPKASKPIVLKKKGVNECEAMV